VNLISEAKESGMNAVAAASVEIHEVPEMREPVVVSAQGLTRRYGAGDTAVDALRGVSLDVTSSPVSTSPPRARS
jgi:hypothetical protein